MSRPPRITDEGLDNLWKRIAGGAPAVVSPEELICLKRTMRLKDYPFIGSLALLLPTPAQQVAWTLDPDHLLSLIESHLELSMKLPALRPSLTGISRDRRSIAEAMDREIRLARESDEERMNVFATSMRPWAQRFRSLDLDGKPLAEAHDALCAAAEGCLPETTPWTTV